MRKKLRIYVAGPYSSNPEANTLEAIKLAHELMEREYVPFVPHLTHYWHLQHPREYEEWLEFDEHWLKQCHALYRLQGESLGADREVITARIVKIPVFYTLDKLDE